MQKIVQLDEICNSAEALTFFNNLHTRYFDFGENVYRYSPVYTGKHLQHIFGTKYGNRKFVYYDDNRTAFEHFSETLDEYMNENSTYIDGVIQMMLNAHADDFYHLHTSEKIKEGIKTTQNSMGAQTETTDINAYTDTGTTAVTTDNNTANFNNKDRTTNEHGAQHGSRTQQAHTDTKTETPSTVDTDGNTKIINTDTEHHNDRVHEQFMQDLEYRKSAIFEKLFADFVAYYTFI